MTIFKCSKWRKTQEKFKSLVLLSRKRQNVTKQKTRLRIIEFRIAHCINVEDAISHRVELNQQTATVITARWMNSCSIAFVIFRCNGKSVNGTANYVELHRSVRRDLILYRHQMWLCYEWQREWKSNGKKHVHIFPLYCDWLTGMINTSDLFVASAPRKKRRYLEFTFGYIEIQFNGFDCHSIWHWIAHCIHTSLPYLVNKAIFLLRLLLDECQWKFEYSQHSLCDFQTISGK